MDNALQARISEAKAAALEVLRHNARGPYHGLPRTAGWGYPEPYTRDLMIASLGILASGDEVLVAALRRVLVTLADNQTVRGHIPSLVHDPGDLGASDTTPLFLLGLALYRRASGEDFFLEDAAQRAMVWMDYQSPNDTVMVGQLPTSDWRDEQWVIGYGLFVNTVVYAYLRFFGYDEKAQVLRSLMRHFDMRKDHEHHYQEGFVVPRKPYYALWAYKVYNSERFDLLGNSLAILSGVASPSRAEAIIHWLNQECDSLRTSGDLAVNLAPNFFPYIREGDADWLPRYAEFNLPGEYHNGGIWPFISGFEVAATVAAGFQELAEHKLDALTEIVRLKRDQSLAFGFNEWIRAQDGTPQGQDWQTWSAAMYLYAATCVEQERALFFEDILRRPLTSANEPESRRR